MGTFWVGQSSGRHGPLVLVMVFSLYGMAELMYPHTTSNNIKYLNSHFIVEQSTAKTLPSKLEVGNRRMNENISLLYKKKISK